MSEAITSFSDFGFITSDTVLDGLSMAIEQIPDVIFIDFHLDIRSGARFVAALRKKSWLFNIPVYAITDSDRKKEEFKRMGFTDVYRKPIEFKKLLTETLDSIL